MTKTFPRILRAAAMAAVIGAAALAAAPAQAQSQPTFSFGFQTQDGFGFSFGNGPDRPRGGWDNHGRPGHGWGNHGRPRHPTIRHCLDDRAVRNLVGTMGYRDVRPFANDGRTVRVKARMHRQDFIVTVDPCRARVLDVAPVRRR
jgi:hypothetical protein